MLMLLLGAGLVWLLLYTYQYLIKIMVAVIAIYMIFALTIAMANVIRLIATTDQAKAFKAKVDSINNKVKSFFKFGRRKNGIKISILNQA